MSKKIDRAVHGPGWGEVILGASLSVLLGVVLGAVLLVLRPVIVAKDTPKEKDFDPKAVYFIEGSHDTAKAKQAPAKRKTFAEGRSVVVTEDELNSLLAPASAGGAKAGEKAKAPDKKGDGKAKEAEKAAPPPAPPADGFFAVGTPNIRIRDNAMTVGVPVTIGLIDQKVMVQARGGFVKKGDTFSFVPESLYLGACPVHRLPFVSGFVQSKFLAAQSIPEDIAAAWPKLTAVAVEGSNLKLTMP